MMPKKTQPANREKLAAVPKKPNPLIVNSEVVVEAPELVVPK